MIQRYQFKVILMSMTALAFVGMTLTGCKSLGGMGDMSALTGSKGSSANTQGVVANSQKMVKNFVLAMVAINFAQSEALEAFGLGDDAEMARQAAKAFESGISDEDEKNKIIAETKARDQKIQEMMSKQEKLTGDARVHFAKSAASYAGASYAGVKLADNAVEFGKQTKGMMSSLNTSPVELAKFTKDVAPGMFVATQIPELSAQWASTTKSLIAYAKTNGDDIQVDKNMINME